MKTAVVVLSLVTWLLHAGVAVAHAPLVIVGEQGKSDAEDTAFLSSVRALAAEIGIAVLAEQVPSLREFQDALTTPNLPPSLDEKKPLLVAWIFRDDNRRTIHLLDPGTSQLRTRTIEAGASPNANAEALALILRAELLATLHEPAPALPPSLPPPLPPSPPPPVSPIPLPPEPAPEPRWAVPASYLLGNFLSGQGVLQGARLGVERRVSRVRLALGYGFFPGAEVRGRETAITLHRHPADLALGWDSQTHHRLRWGAEAYLCGDWISRHTSSASVPLTAQPDRGAFLLSLGARALQEFVVTRHLAFVLGLGMELLRNPVQYQSDKGSRIETVARLSRIRFGAELGVRIAAF
jgi:hypothetical protein